MSSRVTAIVIILGMAATGSMPVRAACGPEQVSIGSFAPEVDRWSDGSGKVVRLTGQVETTCDQATSIEVEITGRNAAGGIVQHGERWLPAIPPGGAPFDLAGALPYDPAITRYEMAVIRTR